MSDEHDVAASRLHSVPDTNNSMALEESTQRQLELYSGSTSAPAPVVNEQEFSSDKHIAYTIKLPAHQLAALQSIWLELKRLYGAHSPDKSGMIQHAVEEWLKRWDGPDRNALLNSLLEIRADTRRRQYKK
jgi:hypothetical protein